MKKITFLSDTHTKHNEVIIEPCDIFCYSGDATHGGGREDFVSFFEWLRKIPAKHIVWIGGNHDRSLDKDLMHSTKNDSIIRLLNIQMYNDIRSLIKDLPEHIHYLQDSSVEIEGIKFYGSPVSPEFGIDWAFNKKRGNNSAKVWQKIPKDTNILLTHTPPYGVFDFSERKRFEAEDPNCGCKDLADRVIMQLPMLKYHSFGHIHNNHGFAFKNVSARRRVCFINACLLDNRHNFITKTPITLNYELS